MKQSLQRFGGFERRPAFWLFLVLSLGWMLLIFCLSAQPGAQSDQLSSWVVKLATILLPDFAGLPAADRSGAEALLSILVRKGAHFCAYTLLAAMLACLMKTAGFKRGWCILLALAGSVVYALSDELHQSFVPGRSCRLYDALVDTSGAIFGLILLFCILLPAWRMFARCRLRRKTCRRAC